MPEMSVLLVHCLANYVQISLLMVRDDDRTGSLLCRLETTSRRPSKYDYYFSVEMRKLENCRFESHCFYFVYCLKRHLESNMFF